MESIENYLKRNLTPEEIEFVDRLADRLILDEDFRNSIYEYLESSLLFFLKKLSIGVYKKIFE